jgi:S-adenosylmethionine synthetase
MHVLGDFFAVWLIMMNLKPISAMKNSNYSFTSESVSEGHPDKVADQISDAILDAYLRIDPNAKVACECLITANHLVISGETNSIASVDAIKVARDVIRRIGYTDELIGFDCDQAYYLNLMHAQSPEINSSVLSGGAGDQGMMFGYACSDTQSLMPLPIMLAHQILLRLSLARRQGILLWLRPDAKSQVSVRYENDKPAYIERIVLSAQHAEWISQDEIREELIRQVINPVIAPYLTANVPDYLINPSGSFVIGGPHGDTGLTGRKIIVDSYGGMCPHGGGAFSGKDPSKVDRSAAYAARFVAKHIVTSGIAERCTIQISYAIGVSEPISIHVNTHETANIMDSRIEEIVTRVFDLSPNGIVRMLDLKRPIYRPTATFGHFGNKRYPWERINPGILHALESFRKEASK